MMINQGILELSFNRGRKNARKNFRRCCLWSNWLHRQACCRLHGLKLWDIAAGTLIVREAGGFVADFSSRDTVLQNGNIVAANAGLHIPLLKMLKEGEKALN